MLQRYIVQLVTHKTAEAIDITAHTLGNVSKSSLSRLKIPTKNLAAGLVRAVANDTKLVHIHV